MMLEKMKFKVASVSSSMKTAVVGAVGGLVAATVSGAVQAQEVSGAPDFSTLTAGIDFSTVQTAVMAVALALVGVYLAIKGAKIVLSMLRGA